jgi:acyl carrier protein
MTVKEVVMHIVADTLAVELERVVDEANFIEDLEADDLDFCEVIMNIEEEFEINIPDEEAYQITDFKGLVECVERKVGK